MKIFLATDWKGSYEHIWTILSLFYHSDHHFGFFIISTCCCHALGHHQFHHHSFLLAVDMISLSSQYTSLVNRTYERVDSLLPFLGNCWLLKFQSADFHNPQPTKRTAHSAMAHPEGNPRIPTKSAPNRFSWWITLLWKVHLQPPCSQWSPTRIN